MHLCRQHRIYKLEATISNSTRNIKFKRTSVLLSRTMSSWEELAKSQRDAINALIPEPWRLTTPLPSIEEQKDFTGYIKKFLSPREIEITETDAVGIVANTTTGKWKAREVAEAFCHRASLAHQMVNCLHAIFFEAAIADAQKLDDYYAEHKKPVGPLHGLPISLKDQFHVKGVETHMGYLGWIGTFEGKKGTGKEKVFESEMVREFRDMGAVLYCKTSVPHTLMMGETANNIIGYTYNPKNRYLSSGGSSGGEGALIGLRGSPLGMGTDIGGSIRIPAAFNGLYGLKPSSGRLPYEGMANSMDGQNSILSVVGPLATSVGALKLAVKAILSQKPWLHDPLVIELPWRDEHERAIHDIAKSSGGGKLAFAVMRTDGVVQPQPPIRRAIDIVVETVKRLGHDVIDWAPPSHEIALKLCGEVWIYDGGADVHEIFDRTGEPIQEGVKNLLGAKRSEQYNASRIADVNVRKRQFQKQYMEYWNSTAAKTGTGRPVDAVISPLAPFPAAIKDTIKGLRMPPAYSMFVNLLDYTASVFPVTNADKNIDVVDKGYTPKNEYDKKVYEGYDPEIFDGAHVALQLVGRRHQEERILTLTEIISEALPKGKSGDTKL
ncbi:amidase signature domain-containing protein [Xylogone sp. PMI_703]|nr:amidase signature domain-containing protein [Xylogone sp. PMI_703]